MANPRKILLADPDLAIVRQLTKGLRQHGYQVVHAVDGSRALELAVLRHPEVILFDEACPLIDPRRFVQILAANPRTADIPVVVTTRGQDPDRLRRFREGVLTKPFNLDEVRSRIDHLCRRVEAARELKGDAREIEGGLSQLPLADLMQILAVNRRTGRLVLTHGAERGEVHLVNGQPANARAGEVEGEKALFRLLAWKEGAFAFAPGPATTRVRITRSMEDALLEGARQTDERERLSVGLPPPSATLARVPDAPSPVQPHPVTAAVLAALEQPRSLTELLDVVDAGDLDVLGALRALLEHGVVARIELEGQGPLTLISAAEVHALRAKLLEGRPGGPTLVTKVIVCGPSARAGKALLKGLRGLNPVASEPEALRSGFGTLGRFAVNEALALDFVLLPTAEAARPLWRPFAQAAVGALVLEDSPAALRLARMLAFELELPLCVVAGLGPGLAQVEQLPLELRGAPAGASVCQGDLVQAVRTVLLAALQPPSADDRERMAGPSAAHDPLTPLGGARA